MPSLDFQSPTDASDMDARVSMRGLGVFYLVGLTVWAAVVLTTIECIQWWCAWPL